MSGSVSPRFPRDAATYYEATCDVCPWTARRHSWALAHEARDRHERTCRPPLPEDIPDIEFPYPPCPICDGDLTHEDGWYCERCEVFWHHSGTSGEYQGEPDDAAGAS